MRHTTRAPRAAAAVAALQARGATLATAESLTGGRLAALMTEIPGSSEVYLGGVVSYATELKVEVLDVPRALVEQYGVVSGSARGPWRTGSAASRGRRTA